MITKNEPIILSASRMTDMPAYYPKQIIEEIEKRRNCNQSIHSLVLWTKHPASLLKQPLNDYLQYLINEGIQLSVLCTISGLGGKCIGYGSRGEKVYAEPNAPHYLNALNELPQLIDLTGNAQRIKVRIDPVIQVMDYKGHVFSNIDTFDEILRESKTHSISQFVFSFLMPGVHKKVDRRFEKCGLKIIEIDEEKRKRFKIWVTKLEKKYNVSIKACCVKDFPKSRCIDGYLLDDLHPGRLESIKKTLNRRELCGCTHSIDIGGWPPKPCYTNCLYCYARPALKKGD